jgi:hypothetical protein
MAWSFMLNSSLALSGSGKSDGASSTPNDLDRTAKRVCKIWRRYDPAVEAAQRRLDSETLDLACASRGAAGC